MTDDLSRPERFVGRNEAVRIREQLRASGGCRFCRNRDRTFQGLGQRHTCGLQPAKRFPDCVDSPNGFDFSEAAFRGVHD